MAGLKQGDTKCHSDPYARTQADRLTVWNIAILSTSGRRKRGEAYTGSKNASLSKGQMALLMFHWPKQVLLATFESSTTVMYISLKGGAAKLLIAILSTAIIESPQRIVTR